jgi:hypothetical protein
MGREKPPVTRFPRRGFGKWLLENGTSFNLPSDAVGNRQRVLFFDLARFLFVGLNLTSDGL